MSFPDIAPEIRAGGSRELVVEVNIKEGWHINSAETPDDYTIPATLTLENSGSFAIADINYPKGMILSTEWGGKMSLYEGDIRIPLVLYVKKDVTSGEHDLQFSFSYQGCNDITCLRPDTVKLRTSIVVNTENAITDTASEAGTGPHHTGENEGNRSGYDKTEPRKQAANDKDQGIQANGPFQNKSLFLIFLLVFIMGLALNLTPCVYPLIPVTMGFFIAQKGTRSPVLLAVMYVIGLAVTYSIIGTLAAFGGSMMGSLLAHPATLIFFSLLMLALSLSMFGLYEFKLPDSLTRASGGSRSGAPGALIMGLTMGVVAAPCIGPFIVSLLSFVAQKGNVVIGFFTFFILALGLGLPYLFLGIFSTKISELPRSGEWLIGIRKFFALALIGMAIYFILPLIPGPVAGLLLPVYMIMAAVYYAVIDRSGLSVPWFTRLKIILSMIVLAAGIIMLKPVSQETAKLSWDSFAGPAYHEALSEEKPLVIDFYADWCNPCKELEHITFSDPAVQEILKDFDRLKVDLTVANAKSDSLREAFDIIGVPTIIFYDSSGKEYRDLRLHGFEQPAAFIKRLEKLVTDEQNK
ncbi:MAG: cytochrome c biogenesis protein CcdA [Candidatus Marinimicrobia bacterium]|nr:cytochrome c biogenesis protein CcdA [Candidatus Neomarinimicrobiota bacterium]